MKFSKKLDLFLNCVLPLLFGITLYYLAQKDLVTGIVRNQVPDAAWAYALLSCLLIIWNRVLPFYWYFIAFLMAAGFEILQWFAIVPGTGDVFDLIAYSAGFMLATISNQYFIESDSKTYTYDSV